MGEGERERERGERVGKREKGRRWGEGLINLLVN